mmetsp:Transcript_221/g.448  ORF Transcript_221/g.448 Transcript_221/m.448 type:complete len:291 (-) Transcript_221:445-1317(-)
MDARVDHQGAGLATLVAFVVEHSLSLGGKLQGLVVLLHVYVELAEHAQGHSLLRHGAQLLGKSGSVLERLHCALEAARLEVRRSHLVEEVALSLLVCQLLCQLACRERRVEGTSGVTTGEVGLRDDRQRHHLLPIVARIALPLEALLRRLDCLLPLSIGLESHDLCEGGQVAGVCRKRILCHFNCLLRLSRLCVEAGHLAQRGRLQILQPQALHQGHGRILLLQRLVVDLQPGIGYGLAVQGQSLEPLVPGVLRQGQGIAGRIQRRLGLRRRTEDLAHHNTCRGLQLLLP